MLSKECYVSIAVCCCNSDEVRKIFKGGYPSTLRLVVLQRIVGRTRRCRLHKLQSQSNKDK
jgi:hypothetical protein